MNSTLLLGSDGRISLPAARSLAQIGIGSGQFSKRCITCE
jgi:hypothetical protein